MNWYSCNALFLFFFADMYIYNVQAQDSDSTNLLGVYGDCQLILTPSYEIICALPSRQVVGVWPFDCLRNFSYGGGIFSFEAGRHAPRGPGEYSFLTRHDHLLHGRLVKLIEKAKRSSWSSSTSSRLSSLMDNRPPAQLPFLNRDSSSDSPVSGDNSDNEESPKKKVDENVYVDSDQSPVKQSPSKQKTNPPPLPENPPPKVPPKALSTQEVWLHERFGPPVDNVQRLLQSNVKHNTQDESGDHVYSHTVHPSASDLKASNDPEVYNSLVHQGGQSKRGHYEMAYPDRKTPLPGEGSATVVYDTAYNDTDGLPPQAPVPIAVPSLISMSMAEGMTANPLYGSQANLLEDIMTNQTDSSSPKSGSPPLPPKPKSLSSSPESVKLPKPSHPDITANPVYVTSNIRKGSPPPSNSQNHTPPINGHTPPTGQSSNGTLDENEKEKENKKYSKINKPPPDSPFTESLIPGSLESDPPPIPERQYSFNEDQ